MSRRIRYKGRLRQPKANPDKMAMSDQGRRRFLLGIFVVSGFTGLIYESIWSQYLKLLLGHAAYAQTLVLAIYMGGMALGSWAVARRSQHIRRLLWAYAVVEGVIGVLGIAFHPLYRAAANLSYTMVIPALTHTWLVHAYKWSLGSLLILPQSVLLGMTFPLISGGLIRRWPQRPGSTLATLYFTNSLGAAIGVLVSGFLLIGLVGLPGTIIVAGLLNLALALVVATAVRGQGEPAPLPAGSPEAYAGPRADRLASWFRRAAFLTGAASFLYEIGWIRMLSLVLGSATHSFELMLAAFILGLAFGGLYVRRRIDRIADAVGYVAGVLIVMGTLAALTLPAYGRSFDVMAWFLRSFARTPAGYVGFNLISQLIAAAIMIPATFCAGMVLPLLTHGLMRHGAGERAIGSIYAANTLGAIAGVLLAIHVLMPLLGVKGVILCGAGIHLGLGLSRLARQSRAPSRRAAAAIALGAGLTAAVLLFVRLDPLRMTSGVYRTGKATVPAGARVEYLRDGKTATISLVEKDGRVTIATNGKPDAGIQMGPGEPSPDEVTMVMAAAVPLSMQPHPARVANIGFGSGLTTHTLLASARVQRLDSIEIEPFMVQAARQGYGARIGNVFRDPRSHILFEDAKTFLASAREPYDLIVSEPSNPWVSGVATLFSDEFYAHIVRYLTPDGVFAQWMQLYETDPGIVASVVKALAPHFGAYALYNVDDVDMLIIATRAAALRPPDDALLQSPLMRWELGHVAIRSVADFQSRQMGNDRTVGPLLESLPVPANSDFYPFVDLNAPRLRYLQRTAIELPALTVLPIPFLELLDGSSKRASTQEPAPDSALFRDRLVARALQVRRAAASGDLNGLDPLAARDLARLGMDAAQCAGAPGQEAWRGAVRRFSDETAPYLSAQELDPLWDRIRAGPCYRALGGDGRAWVDLLAAIGGRDAAEILRLGSGLLAAQHDASPEDRAYLTTLSAAAALRLGEPARAHGLLLRQWSLINGPGKFSFALRDLLALSAPTPGRPALVRAAAR
jgi:predicted membrane-bound spermidine synthase